MNDPAVPIEQQKNELPPLRRTALWWIKFLVSCFGGALTLLIAVTVAAPIFGVSLSADDARSILPFLIIVVAPFVYRYLR